MGGAGRELGEPVEARRAAPAGGGEGGTAKGTYSLSDMIQMAENAGFKGDDAARIAAIAMAESGGKPVRRERPAKLA